MGPDILSGLAGVYVGVLACGVWWTIMGIVVRGWPVLVRKGFRPFLDSCAKKIGLILLIAGLCLIALCIVTGAVALLFIA